MKKVISVFMAILFAVSALTVSAAATNGRTLNDEAYDLPSDIITFDADYIEFGKPVTASVDYSGDVIYKWYVDGVKIYNDSNTFVPTEYDVEKIVTLKVYSSLNKYLGSRSICVSNLPVVYVETENRKEIKDKTEQDAYIKIQGNSQFKDSSVLYEGDTVIKGRGNTTLMDDKKPFKLKLDSKADIFGMGKNKHWVLLSNPYDSASIRNITANTVAAEMGLDYQSSEPVTLVLNGRYWGTYYLCEHVRIGKGRIEITDWEDEAESAAKAIYKANSGVLTKDDRDVMIDNMTDNMDWVTDDVVEYNGMTFTVSDYYEVPDCNGGYLMVIDKNQSYNSTNGISVGIEKPEGIGKGMYDYITGYYQAFEDALFSPDFCTEYNGETYRYTDFIDVESFAKGILLNEFCYNSDFGFRSTYIYKDIDGLLTYGPVWDFDLSCGKTVASANTDENIGASYWRSVQRDLISRFCSDPYFLNILRNFYWEYRYTAIADIFKAGGLIDSEYEKIKKAAYANEETWSYALDFDDSVKLLKRWTTMRAEWFDAQFESIETLYKSMSKFFTNTYPLDDYVSTDNYVEKLEILKYPSKTDYNHGEEIDLSGLELKAYYADGTSEIVEPTGVASYAKDVVGTAKTYIGVISDEDASDIYVSLKYKNASADYKINVSPKEDYEAVIKLINKCPYTDGFNQRYLKEIFEAQAAYNSLSDDAKKMVSNYDRLEAAMNCVDAMADASASDVIGAYISDYSMSDAKKDFVFIAKGNPKSLVLYLSGNLGTATYSESKKNINSAASINGYSVWTVRANTQNFSVKANYASASSDKLYEYNSSAYAATQTDFKKITYTPSVNFGENATINLKSGPLTEKIFIKENGSVIAKNQGSGSGNVSISVPFDSCGEHNVEIWFVSGGNELYYDSLGILVREAVLTPDLPGVIQNVTYEQSANLEKEYAVTVSGKAFKIQFVSENGDTFTFSRASCADLITAYNSDGKECVDEAEQAYEIWNIKAKLKEGSYVAIARTYDSGWETNDRGFYFEVVNSAEVAEKIIQNVSYEPTASLENEYAVTVSGRVFKIQFISENGGTVTFSRTACADSITAYNSDGEECFDEKEQAYEIWNVKSKLKPGKYVAVARTYEAGWENEDDGFEFEVVDFKAFSENVIQNVTYEQSENFEKEYSITTDSRAYKIKFVSDSGDTLTFSRTACADSITAYNSDGEVCTDITEEAYEIWNIKARLKEGHYVVVARTYDSGWESNDKGFEINVADYEPEPEPAPIQDVSAIKIVIYMPTGDSEIEYSVIVDKKVQKIQFISESGDTVTFSRTTYADKITAYNADGEKCDDEAEMDYEIWKVKTKTKSGPYTAIAKTYESGWESVDIGFTFKIVSM